MNNNKGFKALCGTGITTMLLMFFFGCIVPRSTTEFFDPKDLPDPEQLYREILRNSDQISSLQGTAQIGLQALLKKVRLEAVIACDRAGRLRLEIMDFLDRVSFLAVFREGEYLIYSVPDNQFLEGFDERERLRKILGVPLKIQELISLACGCPFFIPMEDPELHISHDKGSLVLKAEQKSRGLCYTVRLDTQRRPEKVILTSRDPKGGALPDIHIDFGRYQQVDSIVFPFFIKMKGKGGNHFFELDYQEISFNNTLHKKLFQFISP